MTKQQAIELGTKDGEADVREVYAGQGVAALRVCQAPGHVSWDDAAISAGAALLAGVPDVDDLRLAYYEAYRAAASKLADSLLAEAETCAP